MRHADASFSRIADLVKAVEAAGQRIHSRSDLPFRAFSRRSKESAVRASSCRFGAPVRCGGSAYGPLLICASHDEVSGNDNGNYISISSY